MGTAEVEMGVEGSAGPQASRRRHHFALGDPLFSWFTAACAAAVAVAMFLLIGVLVKNSWLAVHTLGMKPLTHVNYDPMNTNQYGALSSLFGTFVTTIIAMVIAVPLALGIALLLVEIVHPLVSRVVGTTIEMLAAVPSIIFGLWGLLIIVPLMGNHVEPWLQSTPLGRLPLFGGSTFGADILTAGVLLSLMILPFIAAVTRDVLKMVPKVTKEAGYGMGSTTYEVMRHISMRYALSGIAGAVFLGLGRALGETMAVSMVIGGNFFGIQRSLFGQGTTVSTTMALNFPESGSKLETSSLIELALILFVITMVFQAIAQVWLARARRMTGASA